MTQTPPATSPAVDLAAPLSPDVATRTRADGWTVERQRAFLEALADCGSVRAACARVGMSAQAAYALRRRSDARAFRQAWDAARAMAAQVLEEAAWDRAIHGTVRQHFYHGEMIAETRVYSDKLLLGLIDRNRAALELAETHPEVIEQVVGDWDAALDRIGTGDHLRTEDELNAEFEAEWAQAAADFAAEQARAAADAAPGAKPAAPAAAHAAPPPAEPAPDRPAAVRPAPPDDAPDAAPAVMPSGRADPEGALRGAMRAAENRSTVSTSSTSAPRRRPAIVAPEALGLGAAGLAGRTGFTAC